MERTRSVKLREKALADGRLSLYLDYYPAIYIPETGKETRREFLKIYLYDKPSNSAQKEYNRISKAKAESIRSEREIQFINQNFDFADRLNSKRDFLAYFKQQMIKRNKSKGNYDNWYGTYKYLLLYTRGKCIFGQVDEKFCEGFKTFLATVKSRKSEHSRLSENTKYTYFNKFRACVRDAFMEKLFAVNPILRVKGVPQGESHREFLTLEELKAVYQTECEHPVLKRAAIFSALSGLRWSDMIKLTWKEVQHSEMDGYFIRFTQQKTKGAETLHISDQAFEQMGEREDDKERVFKGLKYSAHTNLQLARWIMNAGITKKITFHCFRHTYATLQLTLGTDIYTVSKLLGHRHLKTTEIYTKVIDKKKMEAASRIKL
ncbi:site-specific integrase [Dyadobacter flavalbus]|uniref:Site-specific integrase n=2 Tax=Dyadobacter flavalbus TaxID=2579942 RepID=A0A5M8QY58_9BACT|nr:site-specific integrase [Dyadobacter flavalbus]